MAGIVNLGIGIPALCSDLLPEGVELRYHAENGILGFTEMDTKFDGDPNIMDAGGNFLSLCQVWHSSIQWSRLT